MNLLEVIQKAKEKVDSIDKAIKLLVDNEDFFSTLKANIAVDGTGISIWCDDDPSVLAKSIQDKFSVLFTRKRITESCYDWVTEVNSVQLALSMVETNNNDLTGSLAPINYQP